MSNTNPAPDVTGGATRMITAMIMSGTIGVAVTEASLPADQVVFFRCLFGAAALAAWCFWRKSIPWALLRGRTLALILLGGFFIVADWVVLFDSYHHISIGLATILLHLQPFFVLLIGAVIQRRSPGLDNLGWVGVAFAGLVLATGDVGNQGETAALGVGLALLAALLYAGATLSSRAVKGVAPEVTALLHTILGVVMLAPLLDVSALPAISVRQWFLLAGLGVVYTGIMYALLYGAYQRLSTAAIAVLSFLYPATAIIVDYLVYGRLLSLAQLGGLVAILLAGTAVNRGWRLLPRKANQTA